MISAISSYLWGTSEDENVITTTAPVKESALENDWIFIHAKDDKRLRRAHFNNDDGASVTSESSSTTGMEESWLVTPPQCFNSKRKRNSGGVHPMENLLIEHPSMSIYQEKTDEKVTEERTEQQQTVAKKVDHKALAGRLQLLEQRAPLKDLNAKKRREQQKPNKQKNLVYVRAHNPRKNKQYGRQSGKHTAIVAKRGN